MIKILHTCIALDNGGVEKLLYNYYIALKDKVQFDFIVYSKEQGMLEDKLIDLGANIFRCEESKQFSDILASGKYDIVHMHGYYNFKWLLLSTRYKVPVRILHSHSAKPKNKPSFRDRIKKRLLKCFSTDLWACGKAAAEYEWGKDGTHSYIMTNAIDICKFKYSEQDREKIRSEYFIGNEEFVLGMVARLSSQKNHPFILRVVAELKERGIPAKFMLVGDGEERENLVAMAEELNILDVVIFCGNQENANIYLNAFDLFVLPSHFEGLPVVLVEAQSNGLNYLTSTNVTREIDITKGNMYLPIDEGSVHSWCNAIQGKMNSKRTEGLPDDSIYSISNAAPTLYGKYTELITKRK